MSGSIKPIVIQAGSRGYEVCRVEDDEWATLTDSLAIEEPLEIRIVQTIDGTKCESPISVTMRTPGDDTELALGFLLSEGLIRSASDIEGVRLCSKGSIVRVYLPAHCRIDTERLRRHFYTSSSCGVCGKTSIDAVTVHIQQPLEALPQAISPELIHSLPDKLRATQRLFDSTGGLHASGLFSTSGELICLREDVGRHNALDKLIGSQSYADDSRFSESILVVSGRVSFELVQKALVAGIPVLVAVGAPSSLAIDLAERHQMTLIGFVRNQRFNIYCGQDRIRRRR
ncbi:formate dehydrogenase accessory protein [Roseimaritima multifibrata]|uniref:Sulfur carrier protein FdhD n=1 Tax=Roseimaritima multifibrata TaxID=1930274 RepID=A0A517MLY0_9BACT|nr:formate dehydrogenase accessory sulfurtransferase FdhD [Roseimaritima multifibrata]QDS95892.1 formate dehydrogenase accessory protein [Roseimaritima multifibrata]